MSRLDFIDDYDMEPPEANEDWVHIDNIPDIDAIRDKLGQLQQMVEAAGNDPQMLQCIDELYAMLEV